jgi:drug/metabolite transporter (DMT)-like permease
MVLFAVISLLLPFSFYFAGLQYLDATRAVVASCLQPVFAIIFAAAFIAEALHWLRIFGIGVVLAASIAIQIPEPQRTGRERDPSLPSVNGENPIILPECAFSFSRSSTFGIL